MALSALLAGLAIFLVIYSRPGFTGGNGEEAASFEISIPETGAYAVAVQARHAEGSISIRLKAS